MLHASPSALITDRGQRVQLRIRGRFYETSQQQLRTLLGLPAGSAGLGITIDGDRLRFEFAADQRAVEISAAQMHRRLAKRVATGTSGRQQKCGPL
jgi:hypothetical protein